ncbi:MAG: GNAT family protein [Undibacterium sp.]|nr:GNAT family protein [Undibacterium sp.]
MNNLKPFDQVRLSTKRLLLRPLESADAQALFAVFSDTKVMRYWSGVAWDSIDTADETIARYSKALAENESLGLGIVDSQTDELIGTCSLFHLDEQSRRAEIGYGIASASWGKGYMHEALTALINYGFDALNLHRMEADTDPRNTASRRCLERLGFVNEGLLRERWIVNNEICDTSFYGLLRSDWQTHTQKSS